MNVIDLNLDGKDRMAQAWLNFARFPTIPGHRKGVEEGQQYKVASFKYEPFELRNHATYEVESMPDTAQGLGQTNKPATKKNWRPHDSTVRVPQKDGFLKLFYTQKFYIWQWLFRLPAHLVNQTGGVLTDKRMIQAGVNPIGDGWYQGNKSDLDIILEQEILFFTIMRFADEIFPIGTLL